MPIDLILLLSGISFALLFPIAFILPDTTSLFPIMEVRKMNNPINLRKIPLIIERLAKAGYILDIEFSKREIKITYNRSASKYTTIPFGQTTLTDFQRGDSYGQDYSKLSHAA
jgi:hypothetical protein